MKILFASSLIFGLLAVTFTSIEKSGNLVDSSKVTYNVTDGKILDGPYTIQDASNTTRLRGSYAQNKRVGNWYCFNPAGKVVLRYNYDLKKIVFLESDELNSVEIKVIDNNPDVVKNARIPLPICSIDQYKSLMVSELQEELSQKVKEVGENVQAEITARIKTDGTAVYNVNYVIKNISYTTMIFPKDKLFTLQWIPATYQDKAYKSEFKFSTNFKFKGSDHKRFIWNY